MYDTAKGVQSLSGWWYH